MKKSIRACVCPDRGLSYLLLVPPDKEERSQYKRDPQVSNILNGSFDLVVSCRITLHAFVRSPHAILHMNEMCASNVKQNRKAARGIQVLSAGTIPLVPWSWHSTLSFSLPPFPHFLLASTTMVGVPKSLRPRHRKRKVPLLLKLRRHHHRRHRGHRRSALGGGAVCA